MLVRWGGDLQIIEKSKSPVFFPSWLISQAKRGSRKINQPGFRPGKIRPETDGQVETLLFELSLNPQLLIKRGDSIPVWPVLGFFIDKDFIEVGIPSDSVLTVPHNKGGNVSLGKGLS
jgi:hypothetical protein